MSGHNSIVAASPAITPSPENILADVESLEVATTRRGRPSRLAPYLDAVKVMRVEKKMTYRDISTFFTTKGITVCPVTVQLFAGKNGLTKKRS